MKRREMNHVARSLCEYLMSRNNDIAGYWGIGALCQKSIKENRVQFHFKVRPGELLRIYSYEILGSLEVTEKLVKPNILGLNIAHHNLAGQRPRYGSTCPFSPEVAAHVAARKGFVSPFQGESSCAPIS